MTEEMDALNQQLLGDAGFIRWFEETYSAKSQENYFRSLRRLSRQGVNLTSRDSFRVAAWRRRQMYDLRLQFRGECGECGSTDRLEFAHRHGLETLRGPSRGLSEVILDIRNNPLNYRLLCRDCHREYDSILESGVEGPSDSEQLEAALTQIGFAPEGVRP